MSIKKAIKSFLSPIPQVLRQNPYYWSQKQFLAQAESWSESQIQDWQNQKLMEVVQWAYHHTTGYKKLYDEHQIDIKNFKGIEDITKLPTVDKITLSKDIDAFSISSPFHHYNTTGGTTGTPFGFYLSRKSFAYEAAFMRSFWEKSGWNLGDLSFVLRGSFIGSYKKMYDVDLYKNEVSISTAHLHPSTIESFVDLYKKFKPKNFQAYPSALSLLCDLLEEKNLIPEIDVPIVFFGSENLYPWQMEKFKRLFPKTKFHAWYGHAEKAIFAPWVPDTQIYEPHPFYGYLELLDKQSHEPVPRGQEGEMVGTGFFALATPLIRYRTEDLAKQSIQTCPKKVFATDVHLEQITGRFQEVILTHEGRYIAMTSMSIHKGLFDNFREFQFYQDKKGEVTLKYIPKKELSTNELENITQAMQKKIGDDIRFKLLKVSEIPRTTSGKFRYLDQKLNLKYND